jgi:hypothetical protein
MIVGAGDMQVFQPPTYNLYGLIIISLETTKSKQKTAL